MEQASSVQRTDDLRPLSEIQLSDRVAWGLLDSAPDGMVMVDEIGRIVLVNRRTEEMFGYDRGELLGQPVEVVIPVDLRQIHRAHRTRYRAEPRVRAMGTGLNLQGRRRDDTLFPVEVSLSPLDDESGDPLIIAAVRDITDRVRAEALDREIRHGLDVVEDGVFMFDADTLRFRYVNQGAVDQVGYSREALLGMTPLHLKPRFTDASFRELLAPLLADEVASVHITTTHRTSDGNDFPVEIVLQSPQPIETGPARTCLAVVRDIRDRVEREQELSSAVQHASVLADRERLARDMHDTVIQELFAAGMSLQATASTMADDETVGRVVAVVDSIDDVIKQLRGTIFGLRSAEGSSDDIEASIRDVVDSASEALGFLPTVNIVGSVADLPDIVVDHLLPTMREALTNTARHAGASEAAVTIDATGETVVLRVVDDGVGMSGSIPQNPGGHGLRNMHDRAVALGGSCEIAAHSGRGTEVEWRVPYNHDQ